MSPADDASRRVPADAQNMRSSQDRQDSDTRSLNGPDSANSSDSVTSDKAAGTPPPQPAPSLFEPNRALGLGLLPDDMPYVNAVDAALHRGAGRVAVRLSLAIGGFLLLLLVWAGVADIDEVTHAEGQVIPSQRTQVIQNLEGGILRAVLVDEGDIVGKGHVLAQLDNELAASSWRDSLGKSVDHALALIRLEAELGRGEARWPEDMPAWLREVVPGLADEIPADVLAQARESRQSQKALLQARAAQRQSELRLLHAQQEQREQEMREMETRLGNLQRSLAIAREQRQIAAQLHSRGSYSRAEYLNIQQQEQQAQSELDSLTQALPRAAAAARARHGEAHRHYHRGGRGQARRAHHGDCAAGRQSAHRGAGASGGRGLFAARPAGHGENFGL